MTNHWDYPDGSWGVFLGGSRMPVERWDPFRTIQMENGERIGHQCVISPIRADRPSEYKEHAAHSPSALQAPEDEDSFCKIVRGQEPAILVAKDREICVNPFSFEVERRRLDDYCSVSIVNLYAPVLRVFLQDGVNPKPDRGIPLVHFPTKHFSFLEEMSVHELTGLLENVIFSHTIAAEALKSAHVEVEEPGIWHFWNIGRRAGASIPHLHSQTYINTFRGRSGWKNHSFAFTAQYNRDMTNNQGHCIACESIRDPHYVDPMLQRLELQIRMVFENDYWISCTGFAPERDGQIRIFPKRHICKLDQASSKEIQTLSQALIVTNKALTRFIDSRGSQFAISQDRNIILRQNLSRQYQDFHIFFEIIPAQTIGGAEMLDDFRICHLFPEESAKAMRLLLESKCQEMARDGLSR